MGFGSIHLSCRGTGREDWEDAELEVMSMNEVDAIQFAEGGITTLPFIA
ncbi:hypothetical protein ACVWZ7_002540 [Arthrobacter sp. TE12232]